MLKNRLAIATRPPTTGPDLHTEGPFVQSVHLLHESHFGQQGGWLVGGVKASHDSVDVAQSFLLITWAR